MKSGNLIALETIHWVLREFSKMIAPFAPFHAEWLWGLLRESDDENSVHLTAWSNVSNFDVKIIKEMHEIRKLISSALEMRAHDGIPVRQPVSSVTFRHARFSFSVKEIIADELNVKNVFFDPMLDSEVAIDTRMTEELIEEGKLRVIVRALQDARKKAGLRVGELVDMRVSVSDKEKTIIQKYEKQITKQASVSRFIFQSGDFSVEPINYDRKKIK